MLILSISAAAIFGSRTEPARLTPPALLNVALEPPYGLCLLARPPPSTAYKVPLPMALSGEKRLRLTLLGLGPRP